MEVVASLSQGRTAAAQCGLFTHKSVPVIFEPPCIFSILHGIISYKVGMNNDTQKTSYLSLNIFGAKYALSRFREQ